jgi:hypothetical protein
MQLLIGHAGVGTSSAPIKKQNRELSDQAHFQQSSPSPHGLGFSPRHHCLYQSHIGSSSSHAQLTTTAAAATGAATAKTALVQHPREIKDPRGL